MYAYFRAPPGCLQYFTGIRATVTSFNWDGTLVCSSGCFLKEQAYRACFRPEKGTFAYLINQNNTLTKMYLV